MGFRDDIRELAYELRSLPGAEFEIRPYTVAVVTRTFTGNHIGEGAESATTTPITEANGQPPRVRILDDEQLALGGVPRGSVEVGPITPEFPGGGTTWAVLSGAGADPGELFYYVLTGPEYPNGARFLFVAGFTDKTFGYRVRLRPASAA
jgi:hypothetical protein